MEWNRPKIFAIGVILLFLGIHFRMVESVVLNEHTTQFLAKKFANKDLASARGFGGYMAARAPIARKVVTPPKWLGWSLLSVGTVVTLHSLVMRRQGQLA